MSAPHQPVTAEEGAAILRLHHVEGWPVGTIASQLHRQAHGGLPITKHAQRGRLVDPYVPFIEERLAKYPRLRASRLWGMVVACGYTGSKSGFRAIVSRLRPRRAADAYVRRAVLPGEEAQVDWAHFGKITVGRAERPLFAFVMVLSFSRMRFVYFAMRAAMPSFLRGHVGAFRFFGAAPRVILPTTSGASIGTNASSTRGTCARWSRRSVGRTRAAASTGSSRRRRRRAR